eukprot:9308971-Ditylum_brightwellii.AAC.1
MKQRITAHDTRAEDDAKFYSHYAKTYKLTKDLPNYWNGSEAQKLLKENIQQNLHKSMKPRSLWLSRPEYMKFDSKTFRKHIYQEMWSIKEMPYWIYKKKKKEIDVAKARNDSNSNELDFLMTLS